MFSILCEKSFLSIKPCMKKEYLYMFIYGYIYHLFIFSQVNKIPETFKSPKEYKNSFITPLLEETHSDLYSNLLGVSRAPFCHVLKIERDSTQFKLPKDLFYRIKVKSITDELAKDFGKYEPEAGDLIAFTDMKPKRVDDLNTNKCPYNVAYVVGSKDEFSGEILVMSSKLMIEFDFTKTNNQKLYAVNLMNLTTNVRIWKALNSQLEGEHLNIIKNVLQPGLNVINNHLIISFSEFFSA